MFMRQATKLLKDQEVQAIEAVITEAESHTSAELVPVIATVSGRYDRSEDLFGFLFALVVLSGAWYLFQGVGGAEAWGLPALTLSLPIVLALLVVSFLVGATLASKLPGLRLPLIAQAEMRAEVERRARETFQSLNVRGTKSATGVLIYVSLYEHQVVVLGDTAISEKFSQDDWDHIRDAILSGFKSGKACAGLEKGISLCGETLAKHFPIESDDTNELHNSLRLID